MKSTATTDDTVTVDDVVRMAIEDLFPDQTVPDENNYIGDGRQHKAPDHSLFGGRILIERKSRNGEDNSRLYCKLKEIAVSQGTPVYAVGSVSLRPIIRALPDPEGANKQMTDFMLRKTMKHVRDARRKFQEYDNYVPGGDVRLLIISDNTTIKSATASDEYFLGRKMGALHPSQDEVKPIDAILFVKNPNFAIDQENSYWLKCLIKGGLHSSLIEEVERIAAVLHHRIAHYQPFYRAAHSFKQCSFHVTIV